MILNVKLPGRSQKGKRRGGLLGEQTHFSLTMRSFEFALATFCSDTPKVKKTSRIP